MKHPPKKRPAKPRRGRPAKGHGGESGTAASHPPKPASGPQPAGDSQPLATKVLQYIARQPRQMAGYKQLIRELGLGGEERRQLAVTLAGMASRGEIQERDDDRFAIPPAATDKNMLVGRLTMHRDGYGFVIPESTRDGKKFDRDIFIPPPAIGPAMHGDRVLVEMAGVQREGRTEGRIVRVVDRAHGTVVGIFHYGDRENFVTSIDDRLALEIIIPPGMERPGTLAPFPGSSPSEAVPRQEETQRRAASSPHRVLGNEARVNQGEKNLEGVVVDVEITDWPTATRKPRGRVTEIIGYEDDFGVDVEIIIRKHHLPHIFPGAVLAEAQRVSGVIPAAELVSRKDYRNLPIVTIDGETARDFDDAVTALRLGNGNYELQVHIADVAHYVEENSAVDAEARLRGTSVYFPDRAVPMLPLELSTDICSLRPQVERLVLSCIMEIDHAGEVVGYRIHEGVIRSAERMTYGNVQLILDGDPGVRERYRHVVAAFQLMEEAALALNRKRVRRGSIDFDLPEPVIEFDEAGLMQGVTRSERQFANRLIEEFMLAANECVASYLEHLAVPSIYRTHLKPEARKVYDFEIIAATFGYSLGVGALPVQRTYLKSDQRQQQRQGGGRGNARPVETPQDVHITPRMYQKLTQKIAGKPEERILSYLMLRSLKQARYSEVNDGHFALAAPAYTHFTSPIRRYPDLVLHRILKRVLREQAHVETATLQANIRKHAERPSPWSKRGDGFGRGTSGEKRERNAGDEELHDIAETSSQTERRADEAERELMEWKKMKFMQQRLGEDYPGLVISITKYGMYVELLDMFIEGFVPLATMTDDRYTFRENTRQIIGERSRMTYAMGDRVQVLVDRIDRTQKRIQFAIVSQ